MKRTYLSAILAALFAMSAQAQFVPNQKGYGPKNGTGYGAKANQGKRQGSGTCDGTGRPKGRQLGDGQRGGR